MDNQSESAPDSGALRTKAMNALFAEFAEKKAREHERYIREHEVNPLEFSDLTALTAVETDEARQAREARESQRAEQRAAGERMQRYIDLVKTAGNRYHNCTLDSFQCTRPAQNSVVDALRDYIANDCNESLILYGPVGTGKDHLAFAVCRCAVKTGKTVKWVNGQAWFGIVRDAMDTDRSEASLIADLSRPALLCLSDPLPPVGALTQHQATMLYRVIDTRYSKGLPTICTVNVANDQEADERMGAATWDRLCHDAYKLSCNWPTYRKPARTN
jgi:DNA replication protein DnaC